MRTGWLAAAPAAVLLAGIAFSVARIPHAVIGKRVAEVEEWRTHGAAAPRLHFMDAETLRVLERVRKETPERCAVLYRGAQKGALEFAPALLFPRLLVREGSVYVSAREAAGRLLAGIVLVAEQDRIRIESR